MVNKTTPLNQIQKIPTIQILRQDTSGHPITYYTCPAGKKAIIEGKATCLGIGAAATVDINAAGISICEWQSAGGGTLIQVPQDLAVGVEFPFRVQLAAGETLTSSQNSGSNANIFMNAEVTETPV